MDGSRFWGRTQCSKDSSGKFTCASGDCGSGQVACNGSGGAPPVTLAEFTIAKPGGKDFFDVSLVDGYNVPLSITPQGGPLVTAPRPAVRLTSMPTVHQIWLLRGPMGAPLGVKALAMGTNCHSIVVQAHSIHLVLPSPRTSQFSSRVNALRLIAMRLIMEKVHWAFVAVGIITKAATSRIKMKVKKQKCHRKTVRFFSVCFGFRQPFKLLCDGTFVHHLVNNITSADTALSNCLCASIKLFTTRCDHEKRKGANACILDVPSAPLIFALRNALFLKLPSSFQHQLSKLLKKNIYIRLKRIDVALSNDVEGLESHDPRLQAHNTRKCSTGKELGVKDRVQFKRKKS
ncbi:hypothetical protein SLEP1_g48467 [Rubroshorea leprosula]|uniref:Uncharacterized protein n=1 Tax=Rubroshorea leprosula TaxID=152421 RepID=A0AAV5LVM6_9ROSI|nr:hypothetical protein SLEP1_g48467 [Rubroshorea leprosula]